jgi:hypothetical protein
MNKHDLYGACSKHEKLGNLYRILVGKLGEKIALRNLQIGRKIILKWISDHKRNRPLVYGLGATG